MHGNMNVKFVLHHFFTVKENVWKRFVPVLWVSVYLPDLTLIQLIVLYYNSILNVAQPAMLFKLMPN
jgi:hypothetical protein